MAADHHLTVATDGRLITNARVPAARTGAAQVAHRLSEENKALRRHLVGLQAACGRALAAYPHATEMRSILAAALRTLPKGFNGV